MYKIHEEHIMLCGHYEYKGEYEHNTPYIHGVIYIQRGYNVLYTYDV